MKSPCRLSHDEMGALVRTLGHLVVMAWVVTRLGTIVWALVK